MADKVQKAKKSKPKPKKDDKGVLAALPSTRLERIGTRRVSAPKTFDEPEAAQAAASTSRAKPAAKQPTKRSSAKPASARRAAGAGAAKRSATKPATARKPAAARATATRRKATAPGTFEPTEAAETAAGAADPASLRSSPQPAGAGARAAGSVPRAASPPPPPEPRPRPVREGAPGMGPSGAREQPPAPERGRAGGVELVTTAVKAAGELTQFGLAIGGQIIKRAVGKLPKP
jgi:hypothetical protein